MARLARVEVFSPKEVAIVHVMNRVVRRCFLLGTDSVTGKNYDHRKDWIEQQLRPLAACFGIDLLGFAILCNHFHLILRSRPDVVFAWDDTEVARRWLMLCPIRKDIVSPTKDQADSATSADRFLSPLTIDERRDSLGPAVSQSGVRCSDKGFLPLPLSDYLELLDWTARQIAPRKRGSTPINTPPILERLNVTPTAWIALTADFGRLFYNIAGRPEVVDQTRSRVHQQRFYMRTQARDLLSPA